MTRRPTLVCLNNGTDTVTRYVPKPTGGFYTESFVIEDREGFNKSFNRDTVEKMRVGKMRDQIAEGTSELEDQLA